MQKTTDYSNFSYVFESSLYSVTCPSWNKFRTFNSSKKCSINKNLLSLGNESQKFCHLLENSFSSFQPGRLKGVQAIGWYLEEANMAQVSVNITDSDLCGIHTVYEECCKDADVSHHCPHVLKHFWIINVISKATDFTSPMDMWMAFFGGMQLFFYSLFNSDGKWNLTSGSTVFTRIWTYNFVIWHSDLKGSNVSHIQEVQEESKMWSCSPDQLVYESTFYIGDKE